MSVEIHKNKQTDFFFIYDQDLSKHNFSKWNMFADTLLDLAIFFFFCILNFLLPSPNPVILSNLMLRVFKIEKIHNNSEKLVYTHSAPQLNRIDQQH